MAEWRLIETAPKDEDQKDRMLGFDRDVGIQIMRYDGWGKGTGNFEYLGDRPFCNEYGWISFSPTHWMSMPEPPK